MKRLAVFVSGAGTGLKALAPRLAEIPLHLAVVVADRPCPALAWAEQAGHPAFRVAWQDGAGMLELLTGAGVDLVLLSGYMRLVPPEVVRAYFGRMVNIHPSLLPAFPGRDAIQAALDYGVKVTGATLHLVDEELDHGPILFQEAVRVEEGDDWQTLRERLRPVEVRLMLEGLKALCHRRLILEGRCVSWR